jgi:hypothetical protein
MRMDPGRRHGTEPPARSRRDGATGRSALLGCRLAGRLGAILLAAALVGACGAGATSTPATPGTADVTPSLTASSDEALVADLAAVMSEPYDAAKVAGLYAPGAVIHETTANMTQRGLDEIGARIRDFNASTFETVVTSPAIRQGDFVAAFQKYGTGGDLSSRALLVYQLKDGLVVNQWVYPAD